MRELVRFCDICGRKIPWHTNRYRFKIYEYKISRIFRDEEEVKCRDMCTRCADLFLTFVKQNRRGADNDKTH